MPSLLAPPYFVRRHDIYFNLARRVWSLRAAANGPDIRRGIVTGHAAAVLAFDCLPRVSAAGRARVLAERRKNVHAFIGARTVRVIDPGSVVVSDATPRLTYNPYRGPEFTTADGGPLPPALGVCYFAPTGRVYYADRLIHANGFTFLDAARGPVVVAGPRDSGNPAEFRLTPAEPELLFRCGRD